MRLVRIINTPKPILYSIDYGTGQGSELKKVFSEWNDIEYLENFFNKNVFDLNQYDKNTYTIDKAIEITLKEANKFEEILHHYANDGVKDTDKKLQSLFHPLNNNDTNIYSLQKSKAKPNHKSWLRLYAIRIAEHLFVISGGAIKLTWRMDEREHTRLELQKMDRTRDYLKEQGLLDEKDFEYIEMG
ncbi:MAG TPA: hypothetical protein VKA34_11240 [Balneolales bacterium]|nr:hypothetical protein [Balneolales bacterium]